MQRTRLTSLLFIAVMLLSMAFFCAPTEVLAQQDTYELLQPIGAEGNRLAQFNPGEEGLSGYLNTLFRIALGIAGVLAVLMVVIGGFRYMTSADDPSAKSAARGQITSALLGLILAFGSVLVLTTINPNLLDFELDLALSGEGFTSQSEPGIGAASAERGTGGCSRPGNESGWEQCAWQQDQCTEGWVPTGNSALCANAQTDPTGQSQCCGTKTVWAFCYQVEEGREPQYHDNSNTQEECEEAQGIVSAHVTKECFSTGPGHTATDACPTTASQDEERTAAFAEGRYVYCTSFDGQPKEGAGYGWGTREECRTAAVEAHRGSSIRISECLYTETPPASGFCPDAVDQPDTYQPVSD